MMSLLLFFGVLIVLAVFLENETFHGFMLLWFGISILLLGVDVFGLFPLPDSELLSTASVLGLVIPFIFFVMAGINSTINDVTRGVQKVNRHLDESHERWSEIQWHEGRQYIYDHERNEWYVFAAHIEQWKPLNSLV